jgi:2-oxoglutarate ferredoxin oxidoreductase subunit alpha
MEPAELPEMRPIRTERPEWAVSGAKGRSRRVLSSIDLQPELEELTNHRLLQRWYEAQEKELRFREYYLEDADFVIVGFGTAGRVALTAVRAARSEGIKVGLLRPITLNPFPDAQIEMLAKKAQAILVVEMNSGQMLDDVRLAAQNQCPVEFYGRMGGIVPFPDEILDEIRRISKEKLPLGGDPRRRWMMRFTPGKV